MDIFIRSTLSISVLCFLVGIQPGYAQVTTPSRGLPTDSKLASATNPVTGVHWNTVAPPILPPISPTLLRQTPHVSRPSWQLPTEIHRGRMAFVAGFLTVGSVGVFMYERSQWWDGTGNGFHFDDQLNYAHNFDKIGHFHGAYTYAMLVARGLEWTGMRPKRAALWGSSVALLIQTQVEIFDGYSAKWGFDRYDQLANTLGVGWFYAQQRIYALQDFQLRFGYFPETVAKLDGGTQTVGLDKFLTDDYANHSYWISMRLWNYLPERLQRWWPSFLQISVGAALDDWLPDESKPGHLSYYLSIDLDFKRIIPQRRWLGRTAADILNLFHFPAPAIRLHPNARFHLLYYGQ